MSVNHVECAGTCRGGVPEHSRDALCGAIPSFDSAKMTANDNLFARAKWKEVNTSRSRSVVRGSVHERDRLKETTEERQTRNKTVPKGHVHHNRTHEKNQRVRDLQCFCPRLCHVPL